MLNEWCFRTATKLKREDGEDQISLLIYVMGSEAEKIFHSFEFEEEDHKKDYKIIVKTFEDYNIPRWNFIHERGRFFFSGASFPVRKQDTQECCMSLQKIVTCVL